MKTSILPHTGAGQAEVAGEFLDKRGLAARWRLCPRSISNLMARGLPHVKIGARRVRFVASEADEWLRGSFTVRRTGPETSGAK